MASFEELAESVRENPGDMEAWDALDEIAAETESPDDVAAAYREALGTKLEAGVVGELGQRAVDFHEEWFPEDSPMLVDVLDRVLAVDPDGWDWAFERLTVVYTTGEKWDELLGLYDRAVAAADGTPRKAELLDEAYQTAKDFASNSDRAIDYLHQLRVERPEDDSLTPALERLLEKQARWADLIALWQSGVEDASAADAAETRLRIAAVHLDHLSAPADAIAVLVPLLEAEGVGSEPALALLERVVNDEEADAAARHDAMALLRDRYKAEGRLSQLANTLDAALEFADAEEQVELRLGAAERTAAEGEHEKALEHLAAVLSLAPAHVGARERLASVAAAAGAEATQVSILTKVADECVDDVARVALRLEAADLLRTAIGDAASAIAHYGSILAEPTVGAETAAAVAGHLAALYASTGQQAEQLEMLERIAAMRAGTPEGVRTLGEVARLAGSLGETDRALNAWGSRLSGDAEDQEALEAIISILESAERWGPLVDALRRRMQGPLAAWQRRSDMVRVASLQADELGLVDDAIASWQEIAETYGEDAEAVDALTNLYTSVERWAELADLLSRAAAREDAHVALVKARLGDTYQSRLGRAPEAVSAYRRALEANPESAEARAGLSALCEIDEVRGVAVEALARSYGDTDEWAPTLALLEQRLDSASDKARKVELLREAAAMQENRAEAPAAALESLRRAFVLAPTDVGLEAELDRLAEATGEWALAAQALGEAAAAIAADPNRCAQLLEKQASLLEGKVADMAGAQAALVAALGCQPSRLDLAEAVVRLAASTDEWDEAEAAIAGAATSENASNALLNLLAEMRRRQPSSGLFEVLDRIAGRLPNDLDALAEAMNLAVDPLADVELERKTLDRLYERAAGLWRRGAAATGEHQPDDIAPAALERLIAGADEAGDTARVVGLLVEGAALPVEADDSIAMRRRAAGLCVDPLGDRPRAIDLYRDVLTKFPDDADTMRALGDLYAQEGRVAELLTLRKQELTKVEDADRKLELRLEIVKLVGEVERQGARVEALLENLRERPGHEASIAALDALLTELRRHRELADALAREASQVEPARSAVLWHRIADIAQGSLADTDLAIEAYGRVVDLEPGTAPLRALAGLHGERGEHTAASRWLERLLEAVEEDEKTSVALALCESLIAAGRGERTLEVLEQARARVPGDAKIGELLAQQYRAAAAHAQLARLLTESSRTEENAERGLELAREAIDLYFVVLEQPEGAIDALSRAVELDTEDKGLRMQLAEAYQAGERFEEARETLTELVTGFGRRRTPERAEVHFRLGQVHRSLGDHDAAIKELESATKIAKTDESMLHKLALLATEAGQLDRAEKAYRALMMIVRRRGADEEVVVGSGEVLYELSAIAEQKGDADKAGELLSSALEAAASSDGEAVRFKVSLLGHGKPELALSGLEGRLEALEEGESKAVVLSAMADVLDTGLGRSEDALTRRLEALEAAPGDVAGHSATRALAKKLDSSATYTDAVEKLVEAYHRDEDASLISTLLLCLGEAVEQDEGDLERAEALYRRAEGSLETPVAAWRALARVVAARGDAEAQREVLAKLVEAEGVEEPERVDALYQLAAAQIGSDEHRDAGVANVARAFGMEPQHERAAAILAAAAHASPDHDGVMDLYESVARSSGDDGILFGFIERRAARSDATLVQVRDAAERATAAGRSELAEGLLSRAVSIAEASEEGLVSGRWALMALAERRAEAEDIAGAIGWMKRAVETAVGDEVMAMELKLAELASRPGGDLRAAADAYERLLEPDPMSREVWEPLIGVYAQLADEDRINDLVASLVDGLLEPADRNIARLVKANYLLGLEGREYDAVDVLKAVLDEEPEHPAAAEVLAGLYEKVGYDEDLVELLGRQLDVAKDNQDLESIAGVSLKLGLLLEKVEVQDAIDVYRAALDWVPSNRQVIEALLALMGPDDDQRDRLEIEEKLLGTETGEAATQLSARIHAEYQALEDQDGMLRALEGGYRGNPDEAGTRAQLEEWLRSAEEWARLSDFLAREAVRLADQPDESMALLQEAAAIQRDQLGDPAGAVTVLRQARQSSDDVGLLEQLVAALEAVGDSAGAFDEVEGALEGYESEDATLVRMLRLRGGLALGLSRTADAVGDLERAYGLAASEAGHELVVALTQHRGTTASSGDADAERQTSLRLVQVLGEMGDREQARDVLSEWVSAHPSDVVSVMQLRDMDLSTENWPGVAHACSLLIENVDGDVQADAVMVLADACEAMSNAEAARSGLERVFDAQPGNERVAERLRTLYEEIGAHRELAQLLFREAETADDDRRFELLRRAGRVLVEGVGDAEAAIAPLEAAHKMRPDDNRVVTSLADAYTGAGRYAETDQLLQQAISSHTKRRSPELSELQHRMARLANAAGDRNIEMQWLNVALESDKNNGEVASDLAYLSMELDELDIALNALRAVTLSKKPGPMSRAMAFLLQARIAHQRGEGRRALLWARKAKSEDPELTEAQDFLRELGEG